MALLVSQPAGWRPEAERLTAGTHGKTSFFLFPSGPQFPFLFILVCLREDVYQCVCGTLHTRLFPSRGLRASVLPRGGSPWWRQAPSLGSTGQRFSRPCYLRDAALLSIQPVRPPASLAPTCSPSGKAGPLPLSWSLLEAQQSGRKTNPPRELGEGKEESESQQEPESQ